MASDFPKCQQCGGTIDEPGELEFRQEGEANWFELCQDSFHSRDEWEKLAGLRERDVALQKAIRTMHNALPEGAARNLETPLRRIVHDVVKRLQYLEDLERENAELRERLEACNGSEYPTVPTCSDCGSPVFGDGEGGLSCHHCGWSNDAARDREERG